ncbi:lipid asymmetry maintenance protein MlaB [Marinomonas sp. IMCC 4694]|uniref:STAS domain-containing protein n=1 Tax=Marinomonas sp. IMCC 4694 TaxID=2605432 RepID=UPI0011E71239|nr:STAS domain-containing protein [Marinomonas sp. IMCC 4694]TYL47593.1 hypothetical protein FXV75_06290 [Marinomonas sp. IMCC 4694]
MMTVDVITQLDNRVIFPEEISIFNVAQHYDALCQLSLNQQSVIWDLQHTTTLDGAGVQLLIAYHQALLNNNRVVSTTFGSDAVIEAFDLFHFPLTITKKEAT